MINKILNICNKVLCSVVCIVTVVGVLFSYTSPQFSILSINVRAQESSEVVSGLNVFGSVGFSDCRIEDNANSVSDDALQNCIAQIVQFFFIVALFIVALRIALEALGGLNPFDKSKAIDNTSKLIKDLIIGLVLLGSPALLLTLFNTTTLNFGSIFSLDENNNVTQDGSGSNTNTGTSGENTNNNNNGGTQNLDDGFISIGDQKYAIGTSISSIEDPNDQLSFTNSLESLYKNIAFGSSVDSNVSLSDDYSFSQLISALKINSSDARDSILDESLEFNNKFGRDNVQITPLSGSTNNTTFTFKINGCSSQASSECNGTASIVESNNGCDGVLTRPSTDSEGNAVNGSVLNSSKLPSTNCFLRQN